LAESLHAAFALLDAREHLDAAVDALVDESLDGFSTQALGDDVVHFHRTIERLEAELIRRLHRFHCERGAQSEGGGTTVSWLRRCGMTVKAAAYRVHLARVLGELPVSLDSARSGRASFTNVAMIGHLAKDVGIEQMKPFEAILVGAAATFEPREMRTLTQATRLRLDPDGVLDDDNRAHERRWFECEQTYGGVFVLRGQLDAEGGALVKTAIDQLSHGLARDDVREGSQRRADALVDRATTQLRCGDHRDVHGQRPHVTVTVSADMLRENSRSARADAAPAELRGVGPIHPETARRIACDAVRTVVTVARPEGAPLWMPNTSMAPLSVERATRTIPAAIRTALVLRDGGCRFPGCDRPPAWTDGHHIIHWADGGRTELDNLVSLCRRHHRRVHEQGWRIHIADSIAVVEPPPENQGRRDVSGTWLTPDVLEPHPRNASTKHHATSWCPVVTSATLPSMDITRSSTPWRRASSALRTSPVAVEMDVSFDFIPAIAFSCARIPSRSRRTATASTTSA
jgi:hypothetical protein